MKKLYTLILVYLFCIRVSVSKAQQIADSIGFYQTINIDSITPCNCNTKTVRNENLNEHLKADDIQNFNLIAYSYIPYTNYIGASKLFSSMERDSSVHKISFMMSEHCFMLVVNENFDKMSFENALSNVFKSINHMDAAIFLGKKNPLLLELYNKFKTQSK